MCWALGSVRGVVVLLAGVGVASLMVLEKRNRKHILENGQATIGWIVQANKALFEDGLMDNPALVLLSPDEELANDEAFMTDLAARILELKGVECDDPDERFVSSLVTDERYVEGKRVRLPRSFTGKREVYLAHIFIYRDDLPRKKLDGPAVPCSVIWDEPRSLICTRPGLSRKRRGES
jgi:hypothetical protein